MMSPLIREPRPLTDNDEPWTEPVIDVQAVRAPEPVPTDEWAVHLAGGRTFFTSGFESVQSLRLSIQATWNRSTIEGENEKGIAGAWVPNAPEYRYMVVNPHAVEAFTDLRGMA